MKKLAMNFLKTADEKLRSIGKHQPATVVQTQNFTFYKSPPIQEEEKRQSKQKEVTQQDKTECQAIVTPLDTSTKESSAMSSRAIARGLRERNTVRGADELERAEIKRRSRSEGPNRRVRQSMDEREGGKKQTYDGGGRYRRELDSPDSDDSDDVMRPAAHESDSESDREKWTKNPLIVRRVKRSDKKEGEKRYSGAEKSSHFKNNESYFQDPNGSGGSQGGSNSGSRDSGRGNSKYQKLEEMRKRRLNLSVTSDEESTPASRISRLRQRAIQSGLGEQTQTSLHPIRPVDVSQYDNVKILRQQNQNNAVSLLQKNVSNSSKSNPPQHTAVKQLSANESKSFLQSAQNQKSVFSNVQNQTPSGQTPVYQQAGVVHRHSFTQPTSKQAPARPPPPNISGTRQSLYSVQDTNRALYNSSPEVTVRKFSTQVRIPSADSILESNPPMNSRVTNQNISYTQNTGASQAAPKSQFNEVVELRLKNFRTDKMRAQQKPSKSELIQADKYGMSEDSLDELIESNIQYLDSELDKEKAKRNSQVVSRSSSLPDPRRMTTNASSGPTLQEPRSFQVQASTSIQFHVSLPIDSRNDNQSGPPLIKIAPSNSIDYHTRDNQFRSQPDVVPRKYSYDSHAKTSRPNSEYFDRDDLSKSDSQLNAQVVIPSYMGNNLHPNQAYARGCMSDMNLRSDVASSLQVPLSEKGMFSDVEYDIEVSERVKKWETYMKVQDLSNEKKNANLTTIQENNEIEALMLPSEVRKSVLLNKQGEYGMYPKETKPSLLTKPRNFSSDTSINKSSDSPKLFSVETNAHRFFQVIQDPQTQPKLGAHSHSISSILRAPITINANKNFMSAKELHQYMLANRQSALPATSGPMIASSQAVIHYAPGYSPSSSQDESSSLTKRSPVLKQRDSLKRVSRYQDELEEISNVKSDSVISLRRRFDTDSATVTSEDDQKSVSTVSARLSRPSQNDSESSDWTKMIPGYQSKIKDLDVWSPNLESTQGVPVSIERVTARTLQTIPFSEDPFWKEIEEMTTFDPSTMAGHLSSGNAQDRSHLIEQVKSQYQVELIPPHSSTLPNQPRSNLLSNKDRMHRSKSLYTPNIAPLTINVDKMSSTISALDDVLDDISRSSIERKQLSPKKRAFETESTKVAPLASVYTEGNQSGYKLGTSQHGFVKPNNEPATKAFDVNSFNQIKTEQVSVSKQPLQFYQQQRQQNQQNGGSQPNRQSQMLPGANNNNYQLDPDLLKQKLLSTGLVVETDTEDSVPSATYRNSSDIARSSYNGATYPANTQFHDSAPTYIPKPIESNPQIKSFIPKGSSALDEIQKALEPFSTSYQPGPESLYGTSTLESFKSSGFDTTRGPQTKSTGWSYQPPALEYKSYQPSRTERMSSTEPSLASTTSNTLQKVNESMDDLKDLAQTVEKRINIIKAKLQSADEKSLDNILSSLKKLTPEVKTGEEDVSSFEDYYTNKKSKLSDALSELDRIYKSLEISHEEMASVKERGKYKHYRPTKSSDCFLAPQPKSEHLKPMQTRISSFYIPGLDNRNKQLDKDTESEFDILSKSFQAIVDEVNQTTDLFSKNRADNTAPETQKQTFKITLKPGESSQSSVTPKSISGVHDPYNDFTSSKTNKSQEVKPKFGRFRSKLQETGESDQNINTTISKLQETGESDLTIKTTRSKSVPELQSGNSEVADSKLEESSSGDSIIATSMSNSALTNNTSTQQAVSKGQRSRVRPVRDNKIIQDDRAIRRGSNEKIMPSPQPSPKVTRKIIYNNGLDLDKKQSNSSSFQDVSSDGAILILPKEQLHKVKAMAQLPDSKRQDSDQNSVSLTVLSPATQKKIPPPTAAKPVNRPELINNPIKSQIFPPSKQELQRVNVNLQLNTNNDSSGSSGVTLTSSTASTASINLTPPVFDGAPPKLQHSLNADSEGSQGGGQRSKRKLGLGVALMLDKFSAGEEGGDQMKKRLGTRSAPDLCTSGDGLEKAASAKNEDTKSVLQVQLSGNQLAKPISLTVSEKSPLMRTTTVSSLERKLTDPESKGHSSGTSSPSSPINKPPQHPWKRLLSDPDRAIESTETASIGSPKIISKIFKTVNVEGVVSKVSETSPVVRRVRPSNRKIQTETDNIRPHSFHELLSYFETRHKRVDQLRKCASADAVYTQVLVDKMFQSEPDLSILENDLGKKNVVLKLEMKVIS
ncbi:uncharacterized protein LOC106078594 isoform X2 [Biomphalaria glabrata]|uniref:Uncharacterized protein LOC106078594 isoform X2 n=2 Tax=Biomphalaria glabrata TaxID=6526 RepID=A0A9W2Z3M5_BIOGL|nr:uncharacterized protein LOC106078594 isoform X2 [Biomphalaria glabrata]XP_055869578.1 uncharacterized protein LOC106078594 isoform X2 [Biomphalaria glabrata]XP_055869579.1 uncharacterized protein LOC106078594 isoform X2 [Biomphalaria glabrata]XP_055869580.1 uncharacterized protein LOC106078594 isoform X2 [Biomphalaria glabrata]